MDEETEFLLKRASEEAALAIRSDSNEASEAHQEMAMRYSAKALLHLGDDDEDKGPAG